MNKLNICNNFNNNVCNVLTTWTVFLRTEYYSTKGLKNAQLAKWIVWLEYIPVQRSVVKANIFPKPAVDDTLPCLLESCKLFKFDEADCVLRNTDPSSLEATTSRDTKRWDNVLSIDNISDFSGNFPKAHFVEFRPGTAFAFCDGAQLSGIWLLPLPDGDGNRATSCKNYLQEMHLLPEVVTYQQLTFYISKKCDHSCSALRYKTPIKKLLDIWNSPV